MQQLKRDIATEVREMIAENQRRLKALKGKRNQFTGKGMPDHNRKVVIEDYPIRTQWLTDEVADNGLYREVIKCKSVQVFINKWAEKTGDVLHEDDVVNQLHITRCQRDPAYAFYTCFMIKDKVSGHDIPFQLNYAQLVVLTELERERREGMPIRIILLKARQWGGSTLVQLYIAWIQLFVKEGWYSVVVAQTKDTAKRIKGMYKKVLESFPAFMLNAEEIKFSPYMASANDSVLTNEKGEVLRKNVMTVASYENHESTRGFDYAMAHYSEVAYWKTTQEKSADEVITNISNGMGERPLTLEVSESTARGMAGFFYEEYQLAKKKKSGRTAIFIPFFYIENDMKEFRTSKERRTFAENLIWGRAQEVAPDETHESGQFLYGLWKKGATLEHIKWYIDKRMLLHSHESMAREAPSDDVECFAFSGNRVFSFETVQEQRGENVSMPIWTGRISLVDVGMTGNADGMTGNADGERRHTIHERNDDDNETLRYDNGRAKDGSLNKTKEQVPVLVSDENGMLKIWKHPNKIKTKNQYVVAVDVGGRGEKADYSVITVVDRWAKRLGGKCEVVARWRGHLRYDLMAWTAVAVAKYYKNALLVFESNTFDKKQAEAGDYVEQGDHIRGVLATIGKKYKNLYKRKATDAESVKNGTKNKIGFQTNRKTKQDMVDNFIRVFEDGEWIDHDAVFYDEAAIYEQRADGSYGNIVGKDNHDDVLMTNMIASLVESEMPMPGVANESVRAFERKGTRNESDF